MGRWVESSAMGDEGWLQRHARPTLMDRISAPLKVHNLKVWVQGLPWSHTEGVGPHTDMKETQLNRNSLLCLVSTPHLACKLYIHSPSMSVSTFSFIRTPATWGENPA